MLSCTRTSKRTACARLKNRMLAVAGRAKTGGEAATAINNNNLIAVPIKRELLYAKMCCGVCLLLHQTKAKERCLQLSRRCHCLLLPPHQSPSHDCGIPLTVIPLCCCLLLAVRWALAGIGTLIIEAVTDSSTTTPEGKSARLIIPLQRHYTDDINQLRAVMLSPLSVLAHQSVSFSSFSQPRHEPPGQSRRQRLYFGCRLPCTLYALGRTPLVIASGHNALSLPPYEVTLSSLWPQLLCHVNINVLYRGA